MTLSHKTLGRCSVGLRHRLEPVIEQAGLVLVWDVDPFVETPELEASGALHMTRFIQEAVTNVLKHAEASEDRDLDARHHRRVGDFDCG